MIVFQPSAQLPTADSMARRSLLETLLATRTAALAAALPPALGGEVGAVHRARVASRRLRAIAPVLAEATASAGRAAKAVRHVTRTLGPVRELDVTAALYAELTATTAVHPLAHAAVGRAIARHRAVAMRAARRALSPAQQKKLRAALDELARDVDALPAAALAPAVVARVAQRARRLTAALDTLGVLYQPERLHAVRIAAKQLRYALEIAADLRRTPAAARLRQLRAVQDLLGRAHDLHVLGARVREVEGQIVTRSRPAARNLRRFARHLDDLCRVLHASFMSRRDALAAMAASLTADAPAGRRAAA